MSNRHIPRRPGVKVIDGVMHQQVLQRQVLAPFKRNYWAPARMRVPPHPLSRAAVARRKYAELLQRIRQEAKA